MDRSDMPEKSFYKIGEVAKLLDVEPYVLRYWESEFDLLEPEKTKTGQRIYHRDDVELLGRIRTLLYEEMFTIAGARRQLELSRSGASVQAVASAGAESGELEVARQEIVSLKDAVAAEAQKREAVIEQARALEAELENLRSMVEDTHVGEAQGDTAALRVENAQLQRELSRLRSVEDELRGQVAALAARLDAQVQTSAEPIRDALRREVHALSALADTPRRR